MKSNSTTIFLWFSHGQKLPHLELRRSSPVVQSHKERWLDSAGSQYSNSISKSVPRWNRAREIRPGIPFQHDPQGIFQMSLLEGRLYLRCVYVYYIYIYIYTHSYMYMYTYIHTFESLYYHAVCYDMLGYDLRLIYCNIISII